MVFDNGKTLEAADVKENQWLRIINAQICYYYKIDPDSLNDEEWAMIYKKLEYIRKKEAEK